jgi:hypothetical protein
MQINVHGKYVFDLRIKNQVNTLMDCRVAVP